MSEAKPGARPSQVTMAGWVAAVASALLVLTLFESMAQVRSIEVREAVDDFLSTPPGSGLGLDVPQVVEILRVLTLLSGAAAAAALVLAIYVLQRNNGARIGFTVAAVAIMLTSPVAGGFLPVMIAFAAIMLWTKPARDWFAGRPPAVDQGRKPEKKGALFSSEDPPRPPRDDRPDAEPSQEWPRMPESGSSDRPLPPPTHGFGSPGAGSPPSYGEQQAPYGEQQAPYPPQPYPSTQQYPPAYPQQQYPPQPYARQYPPYAAPGDADKRPTSVAVAAWLTWVFAGMTTLLYLLLITLLLTARDQFLDALRQEPQFQQMDIATDDMMALLWAMSAIFIFWCLSSIALAVLAYRRVNWARIVLVVSASIATLVSLAAFPVGLLHTLAAAATVALLFLGGANQWYSRKGWSRGYADYRQPPQGQGQQYGGPQPGQPGQYGQQGQYGERPQPRRDDEQDPPTNVW